MVWQDLVKSYSIKSLVLMIPIQSSLAESTKGLIHLRLPIGIASLLIERITTPTLPLPTIATFGRNDLESVLGLWIWVISRNRGTKGMFRPLVDRLPRLMRLAVIRAYGPVLVPSHEFVKAALLKEQLAQRLQHWFHLQNPAPGATHPVELQSKQSTVPGGKVLINCQPLIDESLLTINVLVVLPRYAWIYPALLAGALQKRKRHDFSALVLIHHQPREVTKAMHLLSIGELLKRNTESMVALVQL